MSIADDTMCMHYTLERLGGIKTQTDLQEFMEEIRYNISVNDEHRELNPDGPYKKILREERGMVI